MASGFLILGENMDWKVLVILLPYSAFQMKDYPQTLPYRANRKAICPATAAKLYSYHWLLLPWKKPKQTKKIKDLCKHQSCPHVQSTVQFPAVGYSHPLEQKQQHKPQDAVGDEIRIVFKASPLTTARV